MADAADAVTIHLRQRLKQIDTETVVVDRLPHVAPTGMARVERSAVIGLLAGLQALARVEMVRHQGDEATAG